MRNAACNRPTDASSFIRNETRISKYKYSFLFRREEPANSHDAARNLPIGKLLRNQEASILSGDEGGAAGDSVS